jgi:hypothetical protein
LLIEILVGDLGIQGIVVILFTLNKEREGKNLDVKLRTKTGSQVT